MPKRSRLQGRPCASVERDSSFDLSGLDHLSVDGDGGRRRDDDYSGSRGGAVTWDQDGRDDNHEKRRK